MAGTPLLVPEPPFSQSFCSSLVSRWQQPLLSVLPALPWDVVPKGEAEPSCTHARLSVHVWLRRTAAALAVIWLSNAQRELGGTATTTPLLLADCREQHSLCDLKLFLCPVQWHAAVCLCQEW